MNSDENIKISKFLSLVLRHKPETIGIELDENGWTNVELLIQKSNTAGMQLDFDILKRIVETNNKKRFSFNDTFDKIRASQGHSVEIELGYQPLTPPDILYHGTGAKYVELILVSGLEKRSRHHVHLSADIETALNVGKRHGKPFLFEILSGQMSVEGYEFFLSENGVWLTAHVPVKYLRDHVKKDR